MKILEVKILEAIFYFLCGMIIGALLVGGCVLKDSREEAIKAGVAEYYIDTNTFEREFRYLSAK